jgi:hypothetical protein
MIDASPGAFRVDPLLATRDFWENPVTRLLRRMRAMKTGKISSVAPPAWLLAVAGLVLSFPAWSAEEEGSLLTNRFTASLGTFLMSTDTTLALNGSSGAIGSEINLEKDLGIRGSDRIRVDLNWRMTDKQHLRALYFDFGSDATRRIEEDLVIGDTTYPVNAELTTGISVKVYELVYEYAFLQRDDWELLGSFGAHVLDVGFFARGQGTVGGQSSTLRTEAGSTAAPLPVLGLRYLWQFAPAWYLEAQGQYFQAKIDVYDGNLYDLRAGVTWMFSRHFGVGAGYSRFGVNLDVNKERFRGSLDWNYSGAQIYVTGTF